MIPVARDAKYDVFAMIAIARHANYVFAMVAMSRHAKHDVFCDDCDSPASKIRRICNDCACQNVRLGGMPRAILRFCNPGKQF